MKRIMGLNVTLGGVMLKLGYLKGRPQRYWRNIVKGALNERRDGGR